MYIYIYIYIRTGSARICTPLIVSRSLRSLANYKYSTLPRGISINIAPKVGIFPEAEGRGKYCAILSIFHKEGLNIYFIT